MYSRRYNGLRWSTWRSEASEVRRSPLHVRSLGTRSSCDGTNVRVHVLLRSLDLPMIKRAETLSLDSNSFSVVLSNTHSIPRRHYILQDYYFIGINEATSCWWGLRRSRTGDVDLTSFNVSHLASLRSYSTPLVFPSVTLLIRKEMSEANGVEPVTCDVTRSALSGVMESTGWRPGQLLSQR